MKIKITHAPGNKITVSVTATPKKTKDKTMYDIYLHFAISLNKIQYAKTEFSTGLKVPVLEWSKGKMLGTSKEAERINELIAEYKETIKFNFEESRRDLKTCLEVKQEIITNIKTAVTGNAPRGTKEEHQRRLSTYSVNAVMESYLKYRGQSEEKQRQYPFAIGKMHNYFKTLGRNTPLLTDITEYDLEGFKLWLSRQKTKKGTTLTQDTLNTWLSMVAALFVHAHRRLKILPSLPLPEKFRGAPNRNKKRKLITVEEKNSLILLHEAHLKETEQVAKHCMVVELLTGIDYCDLKTLQHDHIIHYKGSCYLQKNREKTGVEFTVPLNEDAKQALDKLRELAPGEGQFLFDLPSIEYSIDRYKDLAKMVGIKVNVGTKLLRHTFSTHYMDRKGTTDNLQIMLGHSDPRSSQVYGKVTPERLMNDMAAMTGSINPHNN